MSVWTAADDMGEEESNLYVRAFGQSLSKK